MTKLSSRLSDNQRFSFVSNGYSADTFEVVSVSGHEAISSLYRFELILVCDDTHINLDNMLRHTATFQIFAPHNPSIRTPYSGVIAEFDQLHYANGYVFYRAVLVPRMWRLSMSRSSEVYLNEQSIPDIIRNLLNGSKLFGNSVQFKLTDHYRPRSYVCQYQESAFDFISRWMEMEGMYYYFEQSERDDVLVIVDNKSTHAAHAIPVKFRATDDFDASLAANSVQSFICQQRPLPQKVVLQAYNHRKASLPLVATAPVSQQGFGETVYYGENFRDPEEGQRYATIRSQELLCTGKVFLGAATATGLRSGHFMKISGHYRDDFDGRYLVTEITHEGSQAGVLLAGIDTPFDNASQNSALTTYKTSFRAIPADVQYRVPRATPKPRVMGTISATIDAEGSAQYADLDEHGQYKVKLPFDRADRAPAKGSARMRLASPYAGDSHGMHFPLHKGSEVLLTFADGDPDQPVILSAVPNSVNKSVVNNDSPAGNRIRTAGGNQLQMVDSDGEQGMQLYSPSAGTVFSLGASPSLPSSPGQGFEYYTIGNSTAYTAGYNSKLVMGGNINVYLPMGDFTISGPMSTKINMGYSYNYTWQDQVSFTSGSAIFSYGKQVVIANKPGTRGFESAELCGGMMPPMAATKAAVEAAKSSLELYLKVLAAFNFASGVAVEGVSMEQAKNTSDSNWDKAKVYGTGVGLTSTTNLIEAAVIKHYMGLLGDLMDDATAIGYVSNIRSGQTGVSINVSNPALFTRTAFEISSVTNSATFTIPPQLGAVFSVNCLPTELNLDTTGVRLKCGPAASIGLDATGAKITFANSNWKLNMLGTAIGGTGLIQLG